MQEGILRPAGSFISTMEATKKVTISLVLPMTYMLLKATSIEAPVVVYTHANASVVRKRIEVSDCIHVMLCMAVCLCLITFIISVYARI